MVVEIFEVVVDGCRWLLVVVGGFRWLQVVLGGFRSFHVLVLTLFKGPKEKFLKKIGRSITAGHSSGHSLLRSFS